VNGRVDSPLFSATAIAVVLAVVVLLYLLRPPARRVPVASSLIWERVLRSARRRDDRLRWLLSLLLALTISGLLAFSVLHGSASSGPGSGRWVIVVDNSPTMATRTSDGSTRFEQAKRRARELIASLGPGQQVLLADTMRSIALPAFDAAQSAASALERLAVASGGKPAIPSGVRHAQAEALRIFTDGVSLRDLPPAARIESVFEPVENVGISRFELSNVPGDASGHAAFIEVENGGGVEKEVELSLLGGRGKSIVRRLSVPAFATAALSLDVSALGAGAMRAAVTASGDGLALDDVAYAYLPTRQVVRLTLVTDSNSYLEKALSAQPRVRLKVVRPSRFADRGDADAYVFDRYAPAAAPTAPSLLIRPGPAPWLPRPAGEILGQQVVTWDRTHPLLDRLSLRDLRIDKVVAARPEGADQFVLVRGSAGEPLLIARDGIPRWIWLAFSLDQSNFAFHTGFPVLLGNALNWMSSERVIADARLGDVEIPLQSAKVIAMDGSEITTRNTGGATRFQAAEPGIYTALSIRGRIMVVVNALDSGLTQVNRSAIGAALGQASAPQFPPIDSWLVLMAGAVLLLGLEWFSYNRRLTV